MSEVIINNQLDTEISMTVRNFTKQNELKSISIDQTSGRYLICHPLNGDKSVGGNITIYPASPAQTIESPIIKTSFGDNVDLLLPLDAKWDYVRGKIWIADTGNNRLIKIDAYTYLLDFSIKIDYPFAIAVDLNTGGAFVRAIINESDEALYYVRKDGFVIEKISYSGSVDSNTFLNAITTGRLDNIPKSNTIAFDHVRSRAWWISGSKSYMIDTRLEQVSSLDLSVQSSNVVSKTQNITVELKTGNAFVVVEGVTAVTNGSFTEGANGFSSGYSYFPSSEIPSGTFNITFNPFQISTGAINYFDKTTGNINGKMLMVNGDIVSNKLVWKQGVTVEQNSNYTFSMWYSAWSNIGGNYSTLQVWINGAQLGSNITTSDGSLGQWRQFSEIWNSCSATLALIQVISTSTDEVGNDFALDEISMSKNGIVQIFRDNNKVLSLATIGDALNIC